MALGGWVGVKGRVTFFPGWYRNDDNRDNARAGRDVFRTKCARTGDLWPTLCVQRETCDCQLAIRIPRRCPDTSYGTVELPEGTLAPGDRVPGDLRVPGPHKRRTTWATPAPNPKSRPGGPSSSRRNVELPEGTLAPGDRVPGDQNPWPRKCRRTGQPRSRTQNAGPSPHKGPITQT